MTAKRDTKDGPFCWQSKAALKRILDSFDDDEGRACRTRSVYLALCEIASDEGAAQFIVSKGLLAFRAGLSARTVQRVFPDLEKAGVLTIERNATGLKASSRYTLLAVPAPKGHNVSTIGHGVSTIGHGVSTIGHGGGSGLSPLYEERKEPKEPIIAPNGASELLGIPAQPIARVSKPRPASSPFVIPTAEEVTAYALEIGYPIDGSAWCDSYAQKGWMIGKSKMKDWRAAVRNWKANGYNPKGATATATRPEATVRRVNLKPL